MQKFSGMINRQAALRSVLDGIGDGIILTNADGITLYINEAAGNILGWPPMRAVGQMFTTICPLKNLSTGEAVEDPLRQALATGHAVGLDRDTGIVISCQSIYLSATCSPIVAAKKELRGCSVILRNITRIRHLEKCLEEDREYLRAIFSAASVGICMLDVFGAIVEINEAAMEILQAPYDDMRGKQFGDAFNCANSHEGGCGRGGKCRECPIRRHIEKALGDDNFSGDFTVGMKRILSQGEEQTVWLRIFIAQAMSEGHKQLILSMMDVSERQQREDELESARLAAEDASQTKSQFLSNMSHEIRTPINGMIGMIDLTLHSQLSEEQRENLLSAKQCSEDLLRIINDILDFSKLECHKMALETIRYSLPELIMRVIRVHEKVAKEKGLVLFRAFDANLPKFVRGDPLRMRQILHNLLGNAIKFTANGGITLQVGCSNHDGRRVLDFIIRDTGIGMEKADLKKLFQPFSQVDGSTTRKFGGTGLGLMIVKELITCMGGQITVDSEMGKGSSFSFFVPCIEENGADEEIRDKTVFLNPAGDMQQDKKDESEDMSDIADLLQYCEDKLTD